MKLCSPHTNGVSHGAPPFFYDWCHRCQAKLAAGKVTGTEGPVDQKKIGWHNRRRVDHEKERAGRLRRKASDVVPFGGRKVP